MDLPTCPSCAASVLDEDATECPFCGSSMSSSSRTAADGKSNTTTKPAQKAPSTKRNRRETVTDDDPFELERQQQSTKVISLLRKPVKGKMFRVVCPMCDTPGFASSKVVGKEVKCRNPECLAPVFLVPDPDAKDRKSDQEEKPVEKKASKLPLIIVSVLLIGVLSGGYYYLTRVPDSSHLNKPFDNPVISDANKKSFSRTNENPADSSLKQKPNPRVKAPVSPQTVQKEALETIVELSRPRENRSKPFSRRLAAEAYAIAGNIPEAQHQIGHIDEVKPYLPFYKLFPLIEIGWIQLSEKDGAGLKETLNQIEQLSEKIPRNGGRDNLDLAARLAAFLIAAGKQEMAMQIIKNYQQSDSLAQLSAYLQIARGTKQHDFDSLIDLDLQWNSPQWVAVTLILNAHGYSQDALNWAALAPNPIDQRDAVTQWALSQVEKSVADQKQLNISLIQPAEMKLSPVGNAYMFARCARKLISLNQPEAAKEFLAKSKTFLVNVPVPSPLILGGIKTINTMILPASIPLEMLAQSNLQIACAESELEQKKESLQSLKNAVRAIRAIAPSLASVQSKINETSNFNFRTEIKNALNLNTSDRLRMGISKYNQKLRKLKAAAETRLVLLVGLLAQASRSQLAEDVWNVVLEDSKTTDENLKDSLLETSLPAVIIQSTNQNGDQLATQIKQALNNKIPGLSKEDLLISQVTSLLKNGKPEEAAHEINQSNLKKAWKGQLALKSLSYLINESRLKQAELFIKTLKDPVLREDMLYTINAASATQENIAHTQHELKESKYTPTEKISGYLGLVSGIQDLQTLKRPTTPPQKQLQNL